ncbi:hypothetical protein F5050DRAFT_1810751 [Lentinula boryana]|uniref:MI domain-containing protein n=1 Tax=Lentinula boryana TaxID=40481 RepID=A0ABQ8Q3D0_9AGAR|nr:hypothetical protein F5050DRAFT_1810751 [Lentinula boryana]
MPVRKKTSTTRLPSNLLEQIQESDGNTPHLGQSRSKKTPSRKESRKQLRAERKHRKAEFFSSTYLKRPATIEDDSPPRKKIKLSSDAPLKPVLLPEASTSQGKTHAPIELEGQKKSEIAKRSTAPKELFKISNAPSLKAPPTRTQQERNEDAYIVYLEAKLGRSKGRKPKRFDDGLDDLFDFTDSLEQPSNRDDKFKYRVDEDEIDFKFIDEDNEHEDDSQYEDEDLEHGSSVEEVEIEEEEWHGIGEPDPSPEHLEEGTNSVTEILNPPYASATRYIPPQLRAKAETKDLEDQIKLRRQIKGFLNRMSEQNIATILDNVTSIITTLIIDSISSHSTLSDSYVVLYAAFVSSLHKIVGVEFAAYFLQHVVLIYEQHFTTVSSRQEAGESVEDQGKEASNLVVLLSELYNFQVISCVLIFDIIRLLLTHDIQEFQVELLLKIIRNSGQQLRTDDPSALKDIIQVVQNKLDRQESSLSSRTRFMLETLHNLKMNKVKRLGTQNQGGEAVERLKKFLGGLNKKRHVLAHEPLRITLDDLHSAETKGKWWLVGAAWDGDPLVDRQQGTEQDTATSKLIQNEEVASNNALLKMAKNHGMNTDIRRSIFVVLMSSEDYINACERLSQLKLTESQQREIIRVVLHCCGNEKVYNPYYALVCQHLCTISHSYKITLQYCLWDFFRDLGETNVGGAEVIKGLQGGGGESFRVESISPTRMKNLAEAYAWWIAKGSVTLAVLKPIDFTNLKPQTEIFLRQLFTYLFLSSQSKSPLIGTKTSLYRNRAFIEEVFIKVSRLQTLAVGLVIFLSKGLSLEDVDQDTAKLVKWGAEIARDTLQSGLDIIPDL